MSRKKMLADKVADSIYEMIQKQDQFKYGDKLPNENELSEMFNVSRTTLREAIKMLVTSGVLEIKRGRGTFVSQNIVNMDKTDFKVGKNLKVKVMDLFEVRLAIEPEVAYWAAQRATDDELDEIAKRCEDVEKKIFANQERTEEEYRFHQSIANAAHNDFMSELIPTILNAIEQGVKISKEIVIISQDTVYDHRSIVHFLEKRDAEGARTAMKLHLMRAMLSMREKNVV